MLIHRDDGYVESNLRRIAEKARKDPDFKFTSLFHLMNTELLRGCYDELRRAASSGIDGVTKVQYDEHLEANLEDLLSRLHQMTYFPQPVRRVYIPKAGSDKLRPLGIPALEDKLVQAGLVKILAQIYEADFVDESYGFRPERGCHDALRTLSRVVENQSVNFIVEADIKGFFDNVDQDRLMLFLAHRIGDKRVLRYIERILKAGISEDGAFQPSERGTPQGGVISPLLANIYLHYSLDLWVTKKFARTCWGTAKLVRYADDFVVCFSHEREAKRFRTEMEERLHKFGLEVAPEKTLCAEFGRYAVQRAKLRGEKAATFDFLGFTHYCSKSRNGNRFRMKRKTAAKKFAAKLKVFKAWLNGNKTLHVSQIMKLTAVKLRGHYGYYGVTDNTRSLVRFYKGVCYALKKWLGRRGDASKGNWRNLSLLLKHFALPKPRLMVNLF
jgi:RNA-directed DNA polymerase